MSSDRSTGIRERWENGHRRAGGEHRTQCSRVNVRFGDSGAQKSCRKARHFLREVLWIAERMPNNVATMPNESVQKRGETTNVVGVEHIESSTKQHCDCRVGPHLRQMKPFSSTGERRRYMPHSGCS